MILKCITHDFPDRVTYGKQYKVVETNRDNYYIVDDNNKIATVTPNSFNKYFINLVEWREQQIQKITKPTMSNLLPYNEYLISNIETALDYIEENDLHLHSKSIKNILEELITNISSHTDHYKLDRYGEELDIVLSNMKNDFGYNHLVKYNNK